MRCTEFLTYVGHGLKGACSWWQIHNVELYPGKGGQLARAAGTSATLVSRGQPSFTRGFAHPCYSLLGPPNCSFERHPEGLTVDTPCPDCLQSLPCNSRWLSLFCDPASMWG